jgi:hypothetical protein
MAGEYFEKFPTLVYNNTIATNIIARVRLKDELRKQLYQYYLYTVKEGQRPDNISEEYYKRAFYSWLIFFANDSINPLLEWHKDQATLDNYIASKYGSIDEALTKTAYYRVNWSGDTTKLTQSQYDALSVARQKYWTRAFNTEQGDETYWKFEESKRDYSKFVRYERAKLNFYVETNNILKINYTQSNTTDDIIAVGDIVQRFSGNALVARGEVSAVGNNFVVLKHITESGTGFQAGNTLVVRNKENTLVVDTRTELSAPIASDVAIYWEPISFYTFETELNTSRQLISLLDDRYALQAERELRDLLR